MRILIKIGSALVSRGRRFNYRWLSSKVREIAGIHREGHEIVIISSGAVAAGMEIEKLKERPKDVLKLQLLSGEGQIKLMKCYKDYFKKEGIIVAQVLLTHHNFDSPEEERTIKKIMNAYLRQRTIPIVNENDLVNKEELEDKRVFTDNDILAALVGITLDVNLAILLTDVEGLYHSDPKVNTLAELIERVEKIDDRIKTMASKTANSLGLGGMHSKVRAAEMMTEGGIDVIMASGLKDLEKIIGNKIKRTFFKGRDRSRI